MKNKYSTDLYNDMMLKMLSKYNIHISLFDCIMKYYDSIKYLKLKNNKIIDLSKISLEINYVNSHISNYKSLIDKYKNKENTVFLESQLKETLEIKHKLLIQIINNIEKYLMNIKEIICLYEIDNDFHIVVYEHKLHNIHSATIFDDKHNINIFYINGEIIDEMNWKKHLLVRKTRINKLMK